MDLHGERLLVGGGRRLVDGQAALVDGGPLCVRDQAGEGLLGDTTHHLGEGTNTRSVTHTQHTSTTVTVTSNEERGCSKTMRLRGWSRARSRKCYVAFLKTF